MDDKKLILVVDDDPDLVEAHIHEARERELPGGQSL